jgi:hypothetical protein
MQQNTSYFDLDEHRLNYMSVMASSAHTYGNLLATVQKWFLDIFPDNFFKTIHVSSRIAHKQILSTPTQFLKKSKPMIIFRPRIDYNEDTFLGKTMFVERMGGGPINSQSPGTVDLNPFLFDPERNLEVQFSQTRRIMYMDITMVFSTLIQQLNYMDFLRTQFVPGRPFDIDTHLEAYLPNTFMETLGNLAGVPVHQKDGSVGDFLDYLNGHSYFPVTYKLAGETGKEEFYRYYPAKIFTILQDLDKDDGESTNQVMTSYRITLSLKLEFWSPSITYLFSPHIKEIPKMEIPTDSTLIPIYADIFDFDDLELNPGWSVYSHASYRLDKPNDSVDIKPILKQSIIQAIDYHISNHIPLVNLIDIRVRKQGDLLLEGSDYSIDYEKKVVQFYNHDYGYYTYTIVITVDTQYINQHIKDVFHLE